MTYKNMNMTDAKNVALTFLPKKIKPAIITAIATIIVIEDFAAWPEAFTVVLISVTEYCQKSPPKATNVVFAYCINDSCIMHINVPRQIKKMIAIFGLMKYKSR